MLNGIRNAVIIHNPVAGGRRRGRRARQLEQARKILAYAGIETELQATTGIGTATGMARQAVEERRQLVIICGGDGTVNEAVNGLAGSQVPLAVLPAGTANVLAKELGIPRDIPRAAEWVLQGRLARIALGVASSLYKPVLRRFFLCVAGAGADGVMVYSVNSALKRRAGILAYWFEALRQIFLYDFPRFRASANGRELEATLVIVGRTKHYGGPFRVTTGADLFEERFELAACTTRSGLRYLTYVPIIWLGRLRRMRDVHFWKATTLRCEPLDDRPIYAQIDGEVAGRLPIEFGIEPNALTLVVPREKSLLHSPG